MNPLGIGRWPMTLAGELLSDNWKNPAWRQAMAYFERMRDVVSGPFSPDVIRQRTAAGWQMVSIEWRRELPDAEAPAEGVFDEDIPYGLRISDDCQRLEVDRTEHQVLMEIMELLAQDFSYSSIVSNLNEKGFRQRNGQPWSRISVFKMIPRLIEVGPQFFSSQEWEQRRQRFARAKAPE
jgi:Recombinase